MSLDPLDVEADLTRYYDAEGDKRLDRPLDPMRLTARKRILATIAGETRSVLEIGSGPGRDADAFIADGHRYTALDLSIEHLRRCRTTGASVLRGTARQLPVRSAVIDVVWSMSTLMHVPNGAIEGALAEIRRVLRAGGCAAIGVWGGPDIEDQSTDGHASGTPPRLFSRRSAERWRELLSIVGDVEAFDTWGDDPDFPYQYAVVRRS